MKVLENPLMLRRGLLIAASVLSAGALANPPEKSYACHVETKSGFPAYVLVQSVDEAGALAMAKRNMAKTFDGLSVQPGKVVECITPDTEKFRSSTFQQSYEQLEL